MIKDRTERTGRFNLTSGGLATTAGLLRRGSTTIAAFYQRFNYHASFLALAFVALFAFDVVWFAVPETLCDKPFANAANEAAFKSIPQKESLA